MRPGWQAHCSFLSLTLVWRPVFGHNFRLWVTQHSLTQNHLCPATANMVQYYWPLFPIPPHPTLRLSPPITTLYKFLPDTIRRDPALARLLTQHVFLWCPREVWVVDTHHPTQPQGRDWQDRLCFSPICQRPCQTGTLCDEWFLQWKNRWWANWSSGECTLIKCEAILL